MFFTLSILIVDANYFIVNINVGRIYKYFTFFLKLLNKIKVVSIYNYADNIIMELPKGNYYTVKEMASLEGETIKTISQRLFRAGKKPVSKDALYTEEDFEAIRNVPGKGRPAKAKPEAPEK